MIKKVCLLIISMMMVFGSIAPAMASHGWYNSRVITKIYRVKKYMEGNSWYRYKFAYLGCYNRHYTNGRYRDYRSFGAWNIWRGHCAHYHGTWSNRVIYAYSKTTHTFRNHGYWYYRYSGTGWIW